MYRKNNLKISRGFFENPQYEGHYEPDEDLKKGIANIPECEVLDEGWLETLVDMKEINIPASCQEIKYPLTYSDVTDYGVRVERFNVHENNKIFKSIDGCVYTTDEKELVLYPSIVKEKTIHIRDSVEIIHYSSIVQTKIKNIYLGPNVKKIESCSFSSCDAQRIYVASPDVEIGKCAFIYSPIYNGPYEYGLYVGGKKGGTVEKYCVANEIKFVAVEEAEVEKFFNATNKELEQKINEQIDLEGDITIEALEDGLRLKIEGNRLEISVLDNFNSVEINRDSLCKKISKARRDRIETIIIGDGIKSLNQWAFHSFDKLQDFYIGSDVEYIDPCCFGDDYNPSAIEVNSKNKNFKSINSVIYSCDLKELVLYPQGKEDSFFEIPSFVEVIQRYSFFSARNLESVKIGANVQEVKDEAFRNSGLKKIYFDESIEKIGSDLFLADGSWDEDRVYLCNGGFKCGGKADSPIEKYCEENGLRFEVVEDKDVYQFLMPQPKNPKPLFNLEFKF